jgi:hypothetical protein
VEEWCTQCTEEFALKRAYDRVKGQAAFVTAERVFELIAGLDEARKRWIVLEVVPVGV